MLMNIITGGIGSGKSSYLYQLMRENLANNPTANAVLIVPEQFSYTAEKTLANEIGGLGPNKVDVLTFSRLVHRYVNPEGTLLPSGKMMLVSKAAATIGEDNAFFASAKKNGFTASLSDLFSEFRRYGIMPEDLESTQIDNDVTRKKLASVNEIYKSYLEFMGDDFTDSEDSLSVFSELVASSDMFRDTFFFIDDFNDFMPGHYDAIRALLRASRGVFITLGADSECTDIFFESVHKTRKRLSAIALSENAQLYTKNLKGTAEYIKADDIRHLLENWVDKPRYDGECKNIELFTARDLYSEAEHTASKIISLVRDSGYRFRDIGIICGNMPSYLHILNAVFADFNIPFFADEKLAVTMHPVVRTVLSLFNIIEENWSYQSVFDYLRTGYIYIKTEEGVLPIEQEDIDILENYVLARGIRGKKAWFSVWQDSGEVFDDVIENRKRAEFDLDMLNTLREKIIRPFSNFLENRGRTARAIAEAVFGFLCDINLYEGLLSECELFDSAGLRDESEQLKQIWNMVLEVLDQLVAVCGDDVTSRATFADYFKSGLSQCSISIIPSGIDRVSVGTVERNSPARVKVLFIIGANYGSIPSEPTSSAILSSLDRSLINAALAEQEKELAPDDVNRIMLENMKLYRVISTATEKLYISFAASNSEGNALSCAHFVSELLNVFPDMKKTDNIISHPSDEELLSSSKRGFYYMLTKLSEYYREKPEKLWKSVFDWYKDHEEYKDKLDILKTAAEYKRVQPHLSRIKAQLLYGKNKKYSITALEKYSKCPFAYYMERGLFAQPQEVRRVEKSHIGSLLHAAVCKFCEVVEKDAQNVQEIHRRWQELSPDACDKIIAGIMTELKSKILPRAEDEKPQLEYLLSRCERTLRKSVETIRLSLAGGGYTSVCYEKEFEVNIDWQGETVVLAGTIDRIDILESLVDKRLNIRIIDYKSGRKKFSIPAICSRIDMQLILYAIAAVKLYNSGQLDKAQRGLTPKVSAIMYNRLADDIIAVERDDKELAAQKLKKHHKLDGIVILDEDENGELCYDSLTEMDSALSEGKDSDFLNLALKKDGTLASASDVTSRKTFDLLADYMQKSVIDTDKAIKSGNISINPARDAAGSACSFCEFGEACMFDSSFDSCRKLFSGDEKALDFIRKELDSDE